MENQHHGGDAGRHVDPSILCWRRAIMWMPGWTSMNISDKSPGCDINAERLYAAQRNATDSDDETKAGYAKGGESGRWRSA